MTVIDWTSITHTPRIRVSIGEHHGVACFDVEVKIILDLYYFYMIDGRIYTSVTWPREFDGWRELPDGLRHDIQYAVDEFIEEFGGL